VHHYNTDADQADDAAAASAPAAASSQSAIVNDRMFHKNYHGHLISDLTTVIASLRGSNDDRGAIFLLGDSSFDNKYWFSDLATAINGYEDVLTTRSGSAPSMKKDISYWVNHSLLEKSSRFCLNCAVEESTLSDRFDGKLLEHDMFVRDHLREDDIAVISAGGNDIALRPSFGTIANMIALLLQSKSMIESGYCIGLNHFIKLFKTRVEDYIQSITAKTKPKLVVVCMIYYLDEIAGGSWADGTLRRLGYDKDPTKLQLLIRKIFAEATSKIEVEGVNVLAFPLFEVLDGKDTTDYCQRVEPSAQGGEKIGAALVDAIENADN